MHKEKDGPVVGSNAWLLREVKRLSSELAEQKQMLGVWQASRNSNLMREVERLSTELAELKRMLDVRQALDNAKLKVVAKEVQQSVLFAMPEREQSVSDSIERFTE